MAKTTESSALHRVDIAMNAWVSSCGAARVSLAPRMPSPRSEIGGGRDNAELGLGNRYALENLESTISVVVDATAMVLWVAEGPSTLGRFRAFESSLPARSPGG